jgi:small-conductance mechanosensitive channel
VPVIDDELTRTVSSWRNARQRIIAVLVAVFVLAPVIAQTYDQGYTGEVVYLLPLTVAFVAVVCRGLFSARLAVPDLPRGLVWFVLIIGLGAAVFAVSRMNELTALAVAAAACGNRLVTFRRRAASPRRRAARSWRRWPTPWVRAGRYSGSCSPRSSCPC